MLTYVSVEIQDVFHQGYRDGVQSLWGNNTFRTLSEISKFAHLPVPILELLSGILERNVAHKMDASPASPASAENILRLGARYPCLLQR